MPITRHSEPFPTTHHAQLLGYHRGYAGATCCTCTPRPSLRTPAVSAPIGDAPSAAQPGSSTVTGLQVPWQLIRCLLLFTVIFVVFASKECYTPIPYRNFIEFIHRFPPLQSTISKPKTPQSLRLTELDSVSVFHNFQPNLNQTGSRNRSSEEPPPTSLITSLATPCCLASIHSRFASDAGVQHCPILILFHVENRERQVPPRSSANGLLQC